MLLDLWFETMPETFTIMGNLERRLICSGEEITTCIDLTFEIRYTFFQR